MYVVSICSTNLQCVCSASIDHNNVVCEMNPPQSSIYKARSIWRITNIMMITNLES